MIARIGFLIVCLIVVSHTHAQEQKCGDNESMVPCGRSCEPTCTNPRGTGLRCVKQCRSPRSMGCRCNKGFVRDEASQRCVRLRNCPRDGPSQQLCGANERRVTCGRRCESTCTDPRTPRCETSTCARGSCQCMDGFVRNEATGMCVRVTQCPRRPPPSPCRMGEVLGWCGTSCEGTCAKPNPPAGCTKQRCATRGCRCNRGAGLVRDTRTGNCVRMNECGRATDPKAPKLISRVPLIGANVAAKVNVADLLGVKLGR